jgi:hypothetical protein
MVIVKGDVFREEEDPYKIYRANKKTIENTVITSLRIVWKRLMVTKNAPLDP